MIIEGAFYKLPELITRYEYTTLSGAPSIHEHTLHGSFAMCLLTELNSRNLQNPMQYIYLEEPYPKNKKLRSDVCIKIPPRLVQEIEPRLKFLGFRRTNYIEVKLFFEKKEVANQSKTGNVGKIINDLLRLSELATDDAGKYLLMARKLAQKMQSPICQNILIHRFIYLDWNCHLYISISDVLGIESCLFQFNPSES